MSKGKDKTIKELWSMHDAYEFDDCSEEETLQNQQAMLLKIHAARIRRFHEAINKRPGE